MCAVALLLALPAQALVWDNTSTDFQWSTGSGNWDGGSVWSDGNAADFNGAGQGTIIVQGGGVAPSSMSVSSGAYTLTGGALSGAFNLSISGGTLTLQNSNSGWSGQINQTSGSPTIEINNANALGTGPIRIGGGYGSLSLRNTSGGLLSLANDIQFPFTGTRNLTTLGSDLELTGTYGPANGGGTSPWSANIGTSGQTVELSGTALSSAYGIRLSTSGPVNGTFILSGDFTNMNGPLGQQYNGYGVRMEIATDTIPAASTVYLFGSQNSLPETVVASGADRTLGGPLHFDGYAGRVIVAGPNKMTFGGDISQFWNSGGSGAPFILEVDPGSTAQFDGNWNAYPIQGGNAKPIQKTGNGTLLINGDMTAAALPRSAMQILAGTLGGNGTLTSALVSISSGASVAPGTSAAGTLTTGGDYTQQAGSTLLIELAGLGQGTAYDWLSVAGIATLAGDLSVDAIAGFKPPMGSTFDVLTASTIIGSLNLTGPDAAWFAPVPEIIDLGNEMFALRLTSTVPEPTSLVVLALVGLALSRRRNLSRQG